MEIYIAKHYWKNNENATWERHERIDKELFEYLKTNYHNFVKNRPKTLKENGYFIYFCYEDAQDIYDRNITNITFYISKKNMQNDFCNQSMPKGLVLEIFDPKDSVEEIFEKTKKPLVLVGLLIAAAVLFSFINNNFGTDEMKSAKDKPNSIPGAKKTEKDKKPSVEDLNEKNKNKFNQKLKKQLEKIPQKINTENDFNLLDKILIDTKVQRINTLCSQENKDKINNLDLLHKRCKAELMKDIKDIGSCNEEK